MLRCGNASTVWAGAGNRMTMRGAWVRAFRGAGSGHLQARVPFSRYPVQRAYREWRVPMKVPTVRCYSTAEEKIEDVDERALERGRNLEDSAPAEENTEDTPTSADAEEAAETAGDEESKQYKESPAMLIAKAGSSPKIRQQLDGTLKPKLSSKAIQQELNWLKDPKELSHRVQRLLIEEDLPSAVELVRGAQRRRVNCEASWNHLLQYIMDQGEAKAAFRLYNDMKKRGRRPSPITYTIMLKGLIDAKRHTGFNPVKTAMSIYNSISAPNSTVKRNIIHTNVMLEVCSAQRDMNALWQVAGELPEEGPGAPDATAYTVILRAIMRYCQKGVEDIMKKAGVNEATITPDVTDRILIRKDRALKEAKRVWADIIYRWSHDQLELDNTLVHSMATLILENSTEIQLDCYDVLKLYNQTTGIPIFAAEPHGIQRREPPVKQRPNKLPVKEEIEDVPFVDEAGRPLKDENESEQPQEEEEEEEENFDQVFNPVRGNPSYMQFGNRELSMILEACLTMEQGIGAGKAYWNFVVQEDNDFKVLPDHGVCHEYLRLLRQSRSSRGALELVRDTMIPGNVAQGKTFHIAFSCLRRDRRNIHVFKVGSELLALMDDYLALPNPQAATGYLQLIQILSDNPQLLMFLNGLDVDQDKRSSDLSVQGQKLQLHLKKLALINLQPLVNKLDQPMSQQRALTPKSKGRLAHIIREHGVRSDYAMDFMTHAREMVDEVLNAKVSTLSKEERKEFQKYADILKKYSDAEMVKRYKRGYFYLIPTEDQLSEYHERRQAALD